jgi:hypothetical protein
MLELVSREQRPPTFLESLELITVKINHVPMTCCIQEVLDDYANCFANEKSLYGNHEESLVTGVFPHVKLFAHSASFQPIKNEDDQYLTKDQEQCDSGKIAVTSTTTSDTVRNVNPINITMSPLTNIDILFLSKGRTSLLAPSYTLRGTMTMVIQRPM